MYNQQSYNGSLSVTVHGAQNLVDIETFGKQDPYVQLSLDFNNKSGFQKTFVQKNAGKNATWNQTFNLSLNGEPDLFVEIFDEDTTVDGVVAFAAIPLNQVVHSPGGQFNGIFDVYTAKGKPGGEINLTLIAQNIPGIQPGQPRQGPTKGQSYINEAHLKRVKSINSKETAADVGGVALTGILAAGAGFLANKYVQNGKKEEQARKEQELAEQKEREEFAEEKRRFEQERTTFVQTQTSQGVTNQYQSTRVEGHYNSGGQQQERHEERHHSHHSGSSSAREWNPVGTYQSGDKVRYNGRSYLCLQGHTSNPTWQPGQAHSLWQAV